MGSRLLFVADKVREEEDGEGSGETNGTWT